jgi:hypothetical protein
VSNAHRGFPPKTNTELLFALPAALDLSKLKQVETNARSVMLARSWMIPKASMVAPHVKQERIKTKKEKPSAKVC